MGRLCEGCVTHACRDVMTERSDSEAERALGTGIIVPALEAAVRWALSQAEGPCHV
jgi:hypothetical protein